MPALVLGPLLRWVGDTAATVWVETGAPCTVRLTLTDTAAEGAAAAPVTATEPTFTILGHHYALVIVDGLERGRSYAYTVDLDDDRVWPEPDPHFPPSVIRTLDPDRPFRLAFGSCRKAVPNSRPWTLPTRKDKRGHGLDALGAYAGRMLTAPEPDWPDALLLLGDQVYADDTPPQFREAIESDRDTSEEPGYGARNFEDYCYLYREAWGRLPAVRWLLSTVPSAMIFDDHDVHDDWNTSAAWVAWIRSKPWWQDRIVGGLASYWIYQHLGNLAPSDLAENELFARVRSGDGEAALLAYADKADKEPGGHGTRWSFRRDFGTTRLIVIDSRCGRVLEGDERQMLDPDEWRWLDERVTGGVDHLLLATSLPYLLPRSVHDLEGWNEAVAGGKWGARMARAGEWLRQLGDLEHWAAFRTSFDRLAGMIAAAGAGERGEPPASIVLLSGDVHHAYLAEASFPAGRGVRSPVWQATCSPLRNPAHPRLQQANRFANTRAGRAIGRAFAASVRLPAPPLSWRIDHGPYFDNQIATLELSGRSARLRIERPAEPSGDGAATHEIGAGAGLHLTLDHRLTADTHAPAPPTRV
jgi:hypothetical protein